MTNSVTCYRFAGELGPRYRCGLAGLTVNCSLCWERRHCLSLTLLILLRCRCPGSWQALSTCVYKEASGSLLTLSHPYCDMGRWLNLSSVNEGSQKVVGHLLPKNNIFSKLNSVTFRRDLKIVNNILVAMGTDNLLTKFSSWNTRAWKHFINCRAAGLNYDYSSCSLGCCFFLSSC